MKKIKTAFVGLGKSAHRYHLPFIDKTGLFEVIGYYTRSNKIFEMPYPKFGEGIVKFDSVEELCKSDAELVVVVTPPSTHYHYAELLIRAGKNVLVDKPLCFTLPEAKRLFALAKEYGVKLMPYQNRRFDSDFLCVKNVMKNYEMGKILEIESNYTQYRKDAWDKKGNKYEGFIYDLGSHLLDQIISIYGKPKKISCDFDNFKNYAFGDGSGLAEGYIEDYFEFRFIYDKLRVKIRYFPLAVKEEARWVIRGSEALFEKYGIDTQEKYLKNGIFPYDIDFGNDDRRGIIYYSDGSQEEIIAENGAYDLFYKNVYDFLRVNEEFCVKEEETLALIEILENTVNR